MLGRVAFKEAELFQSPEDRGQGTEYFAGSTLRVLCHNRSCQ